jgi:hypothetical protein
MAEMEESGMGTIFILTDRSPGFCTEVLVFTENFTANYQTILYLSRYLRLA